MKNTFKKIFKILYGCDDNIKYKIISTLFITSVIETILSFMYKDNAFLSNLFSNFSGIGFALFLIFLRGFEFSKKISCELLRFAIFFPMFLYSVSYLLHITNKNIFKIILALFFAFISCLYFSSELDDFIILIKTLFKKLKIKLFNTDTPTPTGFKSVLENITVFLVSIGGFLISIETIIKVITQILTLDFK